MNETLKAMMLEATRLTRAGRFAEANALIQRGLGLSGSDGEAPGWDLRSPTMDDVIEGDFEVVADTGSSGSRLVSDSHVTPEGRLDYRLYLPASAGASPPLILMLHGCNQNAEAFAALTRMHQVGEEMGFIVLYPSQDQAANAAGCWNWYLAEHRQSDRGEAARIAGMTRRLMELHGVDRRRVYVAGLSAGGAMALTLAATQSDLFAAVGIHSGLPHASAEDARSAMALMSLGQTAPGAGIARLKDRVPPAILFQGDADLRVHPTNALGIIEQVLGTPAGKESVRQAREEGRVPGGYAYGRTRYLDEAGATRAELWSVQGGGHGWFGGNPLLPFSEPLGPDASREMARFFLAHPRSDG